MFRLHGRRLIALFIASASFVAPAVSAAARKPAKRPKPICAVQSGARVVAQDSQLRIVAINNPRSNPDVRREWRYCLRQRGQRFRVLIDTAAYASGYGELVDVGQVVLSGAYVAYDTETTDSGGRYGNYPSGSVTVRNLATGSSQGAAVAPAGTSCGASPICVVGPSNYYSCSEGTSCPTSAPMLVLSPDGVAAWDAEQKCVDPATHKWTPCAWGIQVLDGRTGWRGVLDTVPFVSGEYPPNPFSGLEIARCVAGCTSVSRDLVTWNRLGSDRFAAVQ